MSTDKPKMDAFIDYLIDNVLFPEELEEVYEDGQRKRSTNQSSDEALPLQS